jgi:hypothetical protein
LTRVELLKLPAFCAVEVAELLIGLIRTGADVVRTTAAADGRQRTRSTLLSPRFSTIIFAGEFAACLRVPKAELERCLWDARTLIGFYGTAFFGRGARSTVYRALDATPVRGCDGTTLSLHSFAEFGVSFGLAGHVRHVRHIHLGHIGLRHIHRLVEVHVRRIGSTDPETTLACSSASIGGAFV